MKTQSILQNMPMLQTQVSGKAAKAGNSTFDSFMAGSVSRNDAAKNDRFTVKQTSNGAKDINTSRDGFNQNKISLKSGKENPANGEMVELDEMEGKVVQLLQDVTGLSEEDVLDILEQLGLTPIDLALLLTQDMIQISPLDVENIKAFIMEVHGVDDESLFLMSDQMSGELNDIMDGLQDILAQELGVDADQLSKEDPILLQSFAEKFGQVVNNAGERVQETVDRTDSDAMTGVLAAGAEDEIPVVVEMEESGTSDEFQNSSQGAFRELHHESVRENESPINAFIERLTESFESAGQEEGMTAQVSMDEIVEQVVNHIRIRVLPQTTSMELQLNPESLGRVYLNVTSQAGATTATLTVQNQVAKEALESQITVLRENLESQGLKVDAVEVNVSNFGFKHPEDSNNGQYQQKKSSQNNKGLRFDSTEEVEEKESVETSEDRQDGNSIVDYTA